MSTRQHLSLLAAAWASMAGISAYSCVMYAADGDGAMSVIYGMFTVAMALMALTSYRIAGASAAPAEPSLQVGVPD